MCQYSLEGYPHRDAKDNEELVLRHIEETGHLGFFTKQSRGTTTMVCVKPNAMVKLDKVKFSKLRHHLERFRLEYIRAAKWEGETDVVVKMTSWREDFRWVDTMEFPDGARMHLAFFVPGTRATIISERDLDKVLGLDQLRAEVARETAREAAPASAD